MKLLLSALVVLTILVAVPFAAGARGVSVGDKVDDATITIKVKAKLTTEHAKNLVKVDVDTRDGVVHLQGILPTSKDKAQAEWLAHSTEGVVAVMNDLKVTGSTGR